MSPNKDEIGLKLYDLKQEVVRVVAFNYDSNWGEIAFSTQVMNQNYCCVLCGSTQHSLLAIIYASFNLSEFLLNFYPLKRKFQK